MRQFVIQILLVASAFVYSFFGEVSAGDSTASSEKPTFFSRMIVCRELKSVLSINDAFLRSEKAGWERLAIDHGRAKRYYSAPAAIDAHICGFLFVGKGQVLQTITVDNTRIYLIRDFTYKQHPIIAWNFTSEVNLGTIFAFQVAMSPPWIVSK